MRDDSTAENAAILIQEIEEALARGTKHFNGSGKLLTTPMDIVEALLDEGKITFEPSIETEKSDSGETVYAAE